MKIRSLASTAVGFAVVVTIACLGVIATTIPAHAQAPQLVDPKALPEVMSGPYKVAVGDVLEINFFKATQMSTTRTVGPDGEVYLPLVGRVAVFGRTVDDITAELNTRYSDEMVNPQITVSVSQYSGMKVYVGGEVNFPGIREYRGGLTLVQAIMDAGSFKTTGRQKEVVLIRKGPDASPVGTIVDCKSILRGYRIEGDVPLAPYDIIYVPRKHVSDVNLFVEQYITNNLPFSVSTWFTIE
jgi:polysaccharide biosynthesis/export protein PslD